LKVTGDKTRQKKKKGKKRKTQKKPLGKRKWAPVVSPTLASVIDSVNELGKLGNNRTWYITCPP
jgi:hypothetical protein